MNIINSFKHNSKFRIRVIIVALIIFLVYSAGGKKEALPSADTCSGYENIWTGTDVNACLDAGCALNAYNAWSIISSVECASVGFGDVLEGLGVSCSNTPERRFLAIDISQAATLCGNTKKVIETSDTFCFRTIYTCQDIPADEQCKASQMKIAKILYPKVLGDCSTAYYAVVFGGGFFALMFLMMAL